MQQVLVAFMAQVKVAYNRSYTEPVASQHKGEHSHDKPLKASLAAEMLAE